MLQDVKKPSKLTGKGPLAEKATSSPFLTGRNTLNGKPAESPRAPRNAAAGPSSEPRPLPRSKQATDNERVIRSRRTLRSDDDCPPAVPGRYPTAGDDLAQWPYPVAGTIRPGLPQHPAKAEFKLVGFGSHGRASGVNGIARGRRSTVSPSKPDDRPARIIGPESQETSDPESEPVESIDAFSPQDVGTLLSDTGTSSSGQAHQHAGVLQKSRQPMRRKDGSLPESVSIDCSLAQLTAHYPRAALSTSGQRCQAISNLHSSNIEPQFSRHTWTRDFYASNTLL